MRDPRNAFRPFIVQETQAAREKLAAVHFAIDALREKITEAAMRGEGSIRLPLGQLSAELRGTAAADRLAEWSRQHGIRLEWSEMIVERPNGIRLRTAEAVLIWKDETLAT